MTHGGDRLSREDWLLAGLAVVAEEGIRGVKVERLATSLDVTKGSFYWHFKNRDEYLESMLQYWAVDLTEANLKEVGRVPAEPGAQLLWLLENIAAEDLNRYDAGIRTWAVFDPTAHEVVQRVDAERLDYIRNLFLSMGFDDCEAEIRSRLSYYYVIGEQVAAIDQTREARLAHVAARHRLLTAPPGQGRS